MPIPKKDAISEKQNNDGKTPLGICYLEKYGKIKLPDEVLILLDLCKDREALVFWKQGEEIVLSKREEIK